MLKTLNKESDGKNFYQALLARFKEHNLDLNPLILEVKIDDVKTKVELLLNNLLTNGYKWLPEYDSIVAWLQNNERKGLLCMGDCGRGKTLFCCKIIPMIFNSQNSKKIYNYVNAVDINRRIDELKRKEVLIIDDIGTEDVFVNYGERRYVFNELVDSAEKTGQLLIVTTNLNLNGLLNKYDFRTVDRLINITKLVQFSGTSCRSTLKESDLQKGQIKSSVSKNDAV